MQYPDWCDIFETSFNALPKNGQSTWTDALRMSVYSFKAMSGSEINVHLIKAIRWAADMQPVPRADKTTKADYGVRDLSLWVKLWRKDNGMDVSAAKVLTGVASGQAYADIVCGWIDTYIAQGEPLKAAIIITNPCAYTEVCNALGINRGPNSSERGIISNHCGRIGFDQHATFENEPVRSFEMDKIARPVVVVSLKKKMPDQQNRSGVNFL